MALRLRRGTDAERLIMTPPEAGELIYTTDTKAVYVGDGTTVGGLPVSGAALDIDDLGNVVVVAPNPGDVLQYDGTQWISAPSPDKTGNVYGEDSTLLIDTDNSVIVGPIVTNTAIVGDLIGDVTGNIVGNVVGDVTGNADGDHTGTFSGLVNGTLNGDVNGSVFGDDSTLLVDAVNNTINTNSFTSKDIFSSNIDLTSSVDYPYGGIVFSNVGVSGSDPLARIRVENNDTQVFSMQSRLTNTFITQTSDASTGITLYSDDIIFDGLNVGIKQYDPTADLDINGVMRLRPQSAAPGTPADGMIAAADGTNWDPAGKSGTDSYPVYYDGSTWNALY